MRFAKFSPFTFNWRIVIGICLAVALIFLYRFSQSNAVMDSRGFIEWGGQDEGIFYRHAFPSSSVRFTVLLLHGQAFSSQTWEDLGTLKYLSSKNYKVVAVDLPGYGKSKKIETPKTLEERTQFVQDLMNKLQIKRPVFVSPSMSGSFSLPYVFEGEQGRNLRGYVPVAPVGTDRFSELSYKSLHLPTLIIYGENDTGLGTSSLGRLRNIPGSVIHMIKGAGHACYLNNGEEFHSVLVKFLEKLQ